jgi:hypothetical protein
MRVLIAMKEDRQLYRDVLAGSLKAMRPPLEVATAAPGDFEERLESFEPHVVICGGQNFRAPRNHLRGSIFPSILPGLFNGRRSFGSKDVAGRYLIPTFRICFR